MKKMTGGQAVIQSLLQNGLNTIYGLPGVQNDWLYNAMFDAGDEINIVHTRHEQGAGYMALGASLATGKTAVANVVPGPGFLNASAALANAYALNAKVLITTGQINQSQMGRDLGVLHAIPDQMAIMKQFTKDTTRITSPAEAPSTIAASIAKINSGRPRPVGLEIPMDVLSKTEMVDLECPTPEPYQPPIDRAQLEEVAAQIAKASNPMIFVGNGAQDVSDEVTKLAELLQAPVVGYRTGRGIMDSRHYLSFTLPEARPLWQDCDLVIALGTSVRGPLKSWGTSNVRNLIRFDVDPTAQAEHGKPTHRVCARLEDSLPFLLESLDGFNLQRASAESQMDKLHQEWQQRTAVLEPQKSFLLAIRDALGDDGIFVDELTQVGFASRIIMPVHKPRTFLSTGYMGTLGYGFPTALGAKSAMPDTRVVSVTGDGGFMFAATELATAVHHNIPLVTVLFNNNQFGNVQQMQRDLYDGRIIASDLTNPDFQQFVESFGACYFQASDSDSLRQTLESAFETGRPAVIEVQVGEMTSVDQFR